MRNERGAITIFAFLAMMFFLIFIMVAYNNVAIKGRTQVETTSLLMSTYKPDASASEAYLAIDKGKINKDSLHINDEDKGNVELGSFVYIGGKIYEVSENVEPNEDEDIGGNGNGETGGNGESGGNGETGGNEGGDNGEQGGNENGGENGGDNGDNGGNEGGDNKDPDKEDEAKTAIAQINKTYYQTLQEAINAVPSNNTETTIIMLKDANENVMIDENKNIILNFKNHKIVSQDQRTIHNSGKLKILDASEISNNSETNPTVYNSSSGVLTIQGGTIKNKIGVGIINYETVNLENVIVRSDNGNAIKNRGSLTVSGTKAQITNYGKKNDDELLPTIHNFSGASIVIKDGTIKNETSLTILNESNGSIDIQGGSIEAQDINTINNRGELIISKNAKISNNARSYPTIYNNSSGILNITGGTINNKIGVCISNYGESEISGGKIYKGIGNTIQNRGTLKISGTAEITSSGQSYPTVYNYETGKLEIIGGRITNTAFGYAVYNKDGITTIIDGEISKTNVK